MKIITSLVNSEVKLVTSLHARKYRKQHNKFIAEGLRTCTTLLDAGFEPVSIYSTAKMFPDVRSIVGDELITEVTPDVMKKMSSSVSPSGLLMVFPIPSQPSLDALSTGLVLAQIADPGNMGTLMRTAAAMNAKTVVCIEGTDPWSPKVIHASAGTIGYLTIIETSWQTLLKHKQNFQLCALVVKDGTEPNQVDARNALLIVGNEAHGIPTEWLEQCDLKITLPMPGPTESLNAAVAGSIALYTLFNR